MSGEIAKLTRDLTAPEDIQLATVEPVPAGAIYMLDLQGAVMGWNNEAQQVNGFSAEEVLGRNFAVFFTDADREHGIPEEALSVAEATGRYEMQGWRMRPDGTFFWAHVVVDAIRDGQGQAIGFVKVTQDLSELRNAQLTLERTREQLARAQKMQAVGELTSTIAHDFKNLLMIVGGQIELARSWIDDPTGTKPLEAIERALRIGDALTRQLITFAHRQPAAPSVLDVEKRISDFREILRSALRGNISLVLDFADDVWPVFVEADQFELAVLNVALHARDAMPEGGVFTISARNSSPADGHRAALEDDYVILTLSDTGSGVSDESSSRVFDPSLLRKDAGRDDLWLNQVRRFARQSGGTVNVATKLGIGTEVTFHLPRSQVPFVYSGSSAQEAMGASTVLLVEDNEDVAEVTQVMLTSLGYAVRWASDAIEAMEMLNGRHDFDIVLSDIVMPGGMDGIDLAHAVKARYSSLPCLLMTAYTDSAQAAGSEFRVLRKPFKLAMLRQALEDMRA